ncbi:Ficolin-1 [Holothuria leucospilota]|uniref:Ficolin-1 n=1 Tax=Holothuria leucospilota TaxID=206669 RepID=A0A9Q1BWT4_HOLLE|nr:Ficolin-1 [Holothuria leucospilota]
MCSCSNGQLTCDNSYRCDVNAVCERRSDYHQCYCNAGFSGNGVTCRSTCRPNEVYGTCTCQKSCANPTDCVSCTGGQECFCPNGFYVQGGDCVRQQDCRCFIDGIILPGGDTYVNSGCTRRCTCTNNRLSCDNNYRCSSNAACRVRNSVRQCYCNSGYEGDGRTCARPYTDCNDVRNAGNTRSDVYSIRPAGYGSSFDVFCNMDIDGGGWTKNGLRSAMRPNVAVTMVRTLSKGEGGIFYYLSFTFCRLVFQRRTNGATDFYRDWASYKNGFGNIRQEFWLGNEKLYYLTQQATYEYRMDFVHSSGSYHHKYSRFRINNESNKYRVTDVGSWSRTREGRRHLRCSYANPNGDYNGSNGKSIFDWYYDDCHITYTEMKIRRTS